MERAVKSRSKNFVAESPSIKPRDSYTVPPFLAWFCIPLILTVTAFLFYYPSLNYPFQFDDIANITKYYDVRKVTFSDAFFGNPRWISMWLNGANYRISDRLSPDPLASYYYRLFNISFHLLTGLILFFVLYYAFKQLKRRSWFNDHALLIACSTMILFLLHPVQTQTVSYVIQGRLEGLAGLSIMLVCLTFLLFATASSFIAKTLFALSAFVIAAFACGTKEIAIVLPALVLLVDWFFVAEGSWHELKKRWWFHAIIWLIVGGLYLKFLRPDFFIDSFSLKRELQNNIGNMITEQRNDTIKPLHYMISEFRVILHYLWIFIWPFNISVDYDWKLVQGFFAPDCIAPFLGLVLIGSVVVHLLRKNSVNLVAFGLLWFFISIAPRATFIPSSELLADYKTYIPSMGWLFVLACALVYGIEWITTTLNKAGVFAYRVVPLASLFLVGICAGFGTYQRNTVWRTAEEFWFNVLSNAPGRARAYNNYGVSLSEQGKHQQAVPYFKKAVAMDHLYPDPLNNLAVCYSIVGDLDQAIASMLQSLRINPYYPEGYNNLGSFFKAKKDFARAENALQVALQLRPHYGKAFYNLGMLYGAMAFEEKDPEQKKRLLEKSWESHKKSCTIADFDNNLVGLADYARTSIHLQKYDDAIFALHRIIKLNPDFNEAYFMLGNVHFLQKDYVHAAQAYEALLAHNQQDLKVANNLAETYLQLGRFEQAIPLFTLITKHQPQFYNAHLRIAKCLYELGKKDLAKGHIKNLLSQNVPPEARAAYQEALTALS